MTLNTSNVLKVRSVSSFETLFRNSKLVSLPRPITDSRFSIKRINARNSLQKNLPTHVTKQIIMTTPSNHSRNDWGLKYSIPNRNKSQYMVSNKLDTMDHLPDFDLKSAGKRHIINRLQEIGLPITPKKRASRNLLSYNRMSVSSSSSTLPSTPISAVDQALFDGSTNTISFTDKFEFKNLQTITKKCNERLLKVANTHRENFKLWVLQECGENYLTINPSKLSHLVKKYLDTHVPIRHAAPYLTVMSTGGLNYNLPGALRQTRFGISNKVIARGRVINDDNTVVALAGVIASCQLSGIDKTRGIVSAGNARMTVKPFIINGINIEKGGSIDLSLISNF
ncbi:hypothetical protein NADFUDRAFT_75436 [Nadsonia fulvescens var. elongata DSM 6958]|uniref:Uncharacterized protein n=1 Tax=Nadsonia fulvescens var. elongata DSM 6958 TaxID=857566 RepID=A0A1E3PEV5_9ASCO|nr:hypothetical protein NADFUDRAFT_75436 [Nadsonia fulvescens var. elongata DSM 6958]